MAYSESFPLERWSETRQAAIATLEAAHAHMGEVDGPGRPLEIGRPIAHAYVLRLVAEFQGFVRDLHDLAAEKLVELAHPSPQHGPILITAATEGRQIDRGNPDIRSLKNDFKRLGLAGLVGKLEQHNGYWKKSGNRRGDQAYYEDLIALRNCLAHGNQGQLDKLRTKGVPDTVTWARSRLPGLNRMARALDRVIWDHLTTIYGVEPW